MAYDMSVHALGEMAEDGLDIIDVEHAVLSGQIVEREKGDPRGTKYVIEGVGSDGDTQVGVVGRFHSNERFLIITVYEVSKEQ
jgi:hypothetical protein